MPKLSIVTVTYNCKDDLERTIRSIISQSFQSYEYIIIDGDSKDGTKDVIEKYKHLLSYHISEPDGGIYYAMNKGIEVATGEWILFFNAGEEFVDRNSLKDFFSYDLTEYDVAYGDSVCLRGGIQSIEKADLPFFDNKSQLKGMGFSHQATFVRTEIAKKYKFDTNFICCADYNLVHNLYSDGFKFIHIPVPIDFYEAEVGFSSENRMQQFLEEARICGMENSLRFRLLYIKRKFAIYIKKHFPHIVLTRLKHKMENYE